MRIGAHESVAGGLHLAFERGLADGAEAIQIFTKSSRQWASKDISEADAQAFRTAHAESGLSVIVHDSYLINLGSEPGDIRAKSLLAFRDELERCERLGVQWLVAHPGAHADETRGLQLISDGIRECLDLTAGCKVGVLLEITAGQGTSLGFKFDHLHRLLQLVDRPERLGICLDTCHLFAAGYDIATEAGYAAMGREIEGSVGFPAIRAIHMNDAKKGLGSRVDRHEHIGEGTLGEAAFARFVRDPRLAGVIAVLETPEGKWKEEIALLKSLRDGGTPRTAPLPMSDGTSSPRKTARREPGAARRTPARR